MSGTALRERLRLLEELRQIVAAMRNLAYAELQRLDRARNAHAKAEDVVLRALADTAGDRLQAAAAGSRAMVWLVIGAERGFCGGFNDQLGAALRDLVGEHADATWMIAGSRLRPSVEALLPNAVWLTSCSGAEESIACIDAWLSCLASTDTPSGQEAPTLWVLHHGEQGVTRHRLLPFPDLMPPSSGPPPIRLLPRAQLLPKLLAEAVRMGLLGALQRSLQQENHWRLVQMQRAQDYLEEAGKRLRGRYFRQRQSEITSELETLMSSFELKSPQQAL